MANTFLAFEETLASFALGRLRRQLMLPNYITRMGLAEFRGRQNDTVNLRVPAILTARDYEWRTRTAPIVFDELEELSIPITLDQHIYSAVHLTDENLTLDLQSFAEQVLQPQVIAVAEKTEALIGTAMVNGTYAAGPVIYTEDATSEGTPFYSALVDARKILNNAHVPQDGRVVLIGADVEASALKEADLRRANTSGSTQTLRRGELGQLAGFTIVTSLSIPPGFAIAFHRTAFVFANVAPMVPEGATVGKTLAEAGIAMRHIFDYDAPYLRDRSVVSLFAGTASVEDTRDGSGGLLAENQRAVVIDFTAAGS